MRHGVSRTHSRHPSCDARAYPAKPGCPCCDVRAPMHAQVAEYLEASLGQARFKATARALCRPSLKPTLRVNTLRTTPKVSACTRGPCGHALAWALGARTCRGRLRFTGLARDARAALASQDARGGQEDVWLCLLRRLPCRRPAALAAARAQHSRSLQNEAAQQAGQPGQHSQSSKGRGRATH